MAGGDELRTLGRVLGDDRGAGKYAAVVDPGDLPVDQTYGHHGVDGVTLDHAGDVGDGDLGHGGWLPDGSGGGAGAGAVDGHGVGAGEHGDGGPGADHGARLQAVVLP